VDIMAYNRQGTYIYYINRNNQEDSKVEEISLRELIENILRGKWIIAVITSLSVLAAGIWSYFILEPTYEAETMLMVTPLTLKNQTQESGSIEGIVSTLTNYPVMTLDTYKEQVMAPEVLQYVRSEAGLNDFSLTHIKELLTVELINNTNILKIKAKFTDPNTAANLANLTSERFSDFVTETGKKQAEAAAEFIKLEMEKEKEALDKASEELKRFLSQPRGPEELHQELNSKLQQLTLFKTELAQILINKRVAEGKLVKAQELLENTPKYIEIEKSVIEDDVLAGIIQEETSQTTIETASLKMTEQSINPAYTELMNHVNILNIEVAEYDAQSKNLQTMIDVRQKEIEILQSEYAEKQKIYEELVLQQNLIKQTYEAYQTKYKEATIKQTADLGRSSIIVVSQAIPPRKPIAPRKILNMGIAFVLGIMISVFIVLFKAYWEDTGTQMRYNNKEKENANEGAVASIAQEM